MTVWMCERCGCTSWYIDRYGHQTERAFYSLESGEDAEDYETIDSDSDGDEEDPCCRECDSSNLLNIDELEDDQIQYLKECPSREGRMEAYEKFSSGESVDSMKKSDSPRKGRLIGGKPIQ